MIFGSIKNQFCEKIFSRKLSCDTNQISSSLSNIFTFFDVKQQKIFWFHIDGPFQFILRHWFLLHFWFNLSCKKVQLPAPMSNHKLDMFHRICCTYLRKRKSAGICFRDTWAGLPRFNISNLHLFNSIKEIKGGLRVTNSPVKNLSFLSNLQRISGNAVNE